MEEEFEPSIPRLEVLETTRSPMFVVVHFSLYISLILAEGIAPCSSLFMVGWCTYWCTYWCKSVYAALMVSCAP